MELLLNSHGFLANLAIYSSLALTLGLLFSFFLRRHAARAFGILWLSLLASILLPLGSWSVKHWQWGLFVESTPPVDFTAMVDAVQDRDILALEEPAEIDSLPASPTAPVLANPISIKPHRPWPWRSILWMGWGMLSITLLMRLIIRWQRMTALLPQCSSPNSNLATHLEQGIPEHLKPSKSIRLLSHHRLRTPAIWCWGKELLLLVPAHIQSQTDWTSVFCHELAHAQRRDHITGLISEIMVCFLPWQPLLWWAKHRLSLLSEQACDDWVLASGHAGADYAESLLNLLPQRQVAFVPTVASSRKGVAGRIERILKDQCGNPRLGYLWTLGATLMVIMIGTGIALAQTRPASNNHDAETISTSNNVTEANDNSSIAWHVMRQLNAGPLLLGMPQHLGQLASSTPLENSAWTGTNNGGQVELNIMLEDVSSGDILIGFFKDARWSKKPVQIRRLTSGGIHTIEGITPGDYQIGAMIGELPVPVALGVQRQWPQPVHIQPGQTTQIDLLISTKFKRYASGWYNERVSKDFISDWSELETSNLLQGHLRLSSGQPVPYGLIQVREYRPNARSIAAPDLGTNERGEYRCDEIAWPYRVNALRYEMLPSILGYRVQQHFDSQVLEGSQTVNFTFEPFATGTAKVQGQVLTQTGEPLQEYFLSCDVGDIDFAEKSKQLNGERYSMTTYRIPCINPEGRFYIAGLPAGACRIHVVPFNIQAYELNWGQEYDLMSNEVTEVLITVTQKNIYYGRILFKDGTPALVDSQKTKILMPAGGRAIVLAEIESDGTFSLRLDEREITSLQNGSAKLIVTIGGEVTADVPFDQLQSDQNQAGVITVKRPNVEQSSSDTITQNPGESDAAFRARRARVLAQQRARQRRTEP